MKKNIIWDWNGTLLNDIDICISVMNSILKEGKLKVIPNIEMYQELFCFPVREYYQKLGFNFSTQPFESLAKIFVERYQSNVQDSDLYPEALTVLQQMRRNNRRQVILSASKTEHLLEQMRPFSISQYFDDILGLDDCYAKSKIEVGKQWMMENKISRDDSVVIGDTIHDYEVSVELGCTCILIANGHQSKKVLSNCNCVIINSLSEVPMYLR